MSLQTVGAICVGLTVGWGAGRPRVRGFAVGEFAVALALAAALTDALIGTDAAVGATAVGAVSGFLARLLVDLGLTRHATNQRRR